MDEIILFHFKHCIFGLKVPAFTGFLFQLIKVCGYKRSKDWERLRKLPKEVLCTCVLYVQPYAHSCQPSQGIWPPSNKTEVHFI